MTAVSTTEACRELTIARVGAGGCIMLDGPRAGNAITGRMRAEIAQAIPRFARDPGVYALIIRSATPAIFTAGRDLAELTRAAHEQPAEARRLLSEEYALCWLLECFSKPMVSLIDGLVTGSGAGLAIYGTHRVAGENFAFALPETALGLVPDNGLAWVLARMPGQIGLYLGLTGRTIGRADAYRLGLVTHCIAAARFGEVEEGLCSADPVDVLLDDRHEDPGAGEIETYRELIERCFGCETVEGILARLAEETDKGGAAGMWCAGVLADLNQRSPTALKVAFRHIRDAAFRDLRQTLMLDYRLGRRLIQTHDFEEGVGAFLDNCRQPRWSPSHISEVTDSGVERFFEYQPARELTLPTRQEMQAARI